jgi:hypothetical protein
MAVGLLSMPFEVLEMIFGAVRFLDLAHLLETSTSIKV